MNNNYLRRIDLDNNATRLPICFCIDTSHSMDKVVDGFETVRGTGRTIYTDKSNYEEVDGGITMMDKLNEGVENFYRAILKDNTASDSCEAAIVTFNDEPTLYDVFSPIEEKNAPDFKVKKNSNTNVTPAIRMALDLLAEQRELYRKNRVRFYTPWLVLFTDGLSSDDVYLIERELMELQEREELFVYAMALDKDEKLLKTLRRFSKMDPIQCSDHREIQHFFSFLARSVSVVAGGGIPKTYKPMEPINNQGKAPKNYF